MNYKAVISKGLNRAIGQLGLSRTLKVKLLASIHDQLPKVVEQFRGDRYPGDERSFLYRVDFEDLEANHHFLIKVDDTTAPGFLMVETIHYVKKDKS